MPEREHIDIDKAELRARAVITGRFGSHAGYEGQLTVRSCLPAACDVEGAEEGDWTPSEDRGYCWSFEQALAEQQRREER